MVLAQHQSKTVEHYTPKDIASRFRRLLGGFELDVASCERANSIIEAERFITEEQDGLSVSWEARSVFCNAPGGKIGNTSSQAVWWDKMHQHHLAGDFIEGAFVCFNTSLIRLAPDIFRYYVIIPSNRLRYEAYNDELGVIMPGQWRYWEEIDPKTEEVIIKRKWTDSPSHDSLLVYLPDLDEIDLRDERRRVKEIFPFPEFSIIMNCANNSLVFNRHKK